jgi:cell division protein FtsW (lipid II flippase)
VGGEDLGRLSVTEPERPKAPWHPFPLVELCVLAGIVLLVLGLINFDSDRGRAMLVSGMLLGSLGGLDTALREHFSGFRSHTTILAGLICVAVAAILFFAGAPWPAVIAGAAAALALGVWLFARAYTRRR